MRSFIFLLIILNYAFALSGSVPVVEQTEQENMAAETLLHVDTGVEHSNQGLRKARQFYGPFYGGYYGYGYPYYGSYGYLRPYYYGGYYRPYYGIYGGFYG